MKRCLLFVFLMLSLALSACGPEAAVPAATDSLPAETQAAPPPEPPPTEAPPAAPEPEPAGLPALPPDPQVITVEVEDGQELEAVYYPAAVNPAPLVVFIHWVAGDKSDWYEVAPWLQNRGLQNPYQNPGDNPWWDPAWFPPVPEDVSYGVFIVSLRSCEPFDVGCAGYEPENWLLDIKATLLTASELEGVDPARIAVIGSSIGADGAPDGCVLFNEVKPGSCQGALSLSPGSYLGMPYTEVVQKLDQENPPKPVWCLYSVDDKAASTTCKSASGTAYRAFEFPGWSHGTALLEPDLDPLPMQLILDFLAETIGG